MVVWIAGHSNSDRLQPFEYQTSPLFSQILSAFVLCSQNLNNGFSFNEKNQVMEWTIICHLISHSFAFEKLENWDFDFVNFFFETLKLFSKGFYYNDPKDITQVYR